MTGHLGDFSGIIITTSWCRAYSLVPYVIHLVMKGWQKKKKKERKNADPVQAGKVEVLNDDDKKCAFFDIGTIIFVHLFQRVVTVA